MGNLLLGRRRRHIITIEFAQQVIILFWSKETTAFERDKDPFLQPLFFQQDRTRDGKVTDILTRFVRIPFHLFVHFQQQLMDGKERMGQFPYQDIEVFFQ